MTLGSLWGSVPAKTTLWMRVGTAAVVCGLALGVPQVLDGARGLPLTDTSSDWLLMPSLALSLGGGYAVLFPGVRVGRGRVRVLRDWKHQPRCGKCLVAAAATITVLAVVLCLIAAGISARQASLSIFLFLGAYFALIGWTAALLGAAVTSRRPGPPDVLGSGTLP